MIPPPKPYNERKRLETLRSLKILDTDPEERFDRFTRLAAKLFDVPIALVSLVGANRQWFKSRHGLAACETSRDISFCGHAILNDDVLVIEDALKDHRFVDNPLVTADPHIRFYAGYPLTAPDGNNMGTLCVIGREPRAMSHEDLGLLRELGRAIEQEMVALNRGTVDDTTALSNLRGFESMAKQAIAVSERLERPATFMYMKLNNVARMVESAGQDGLKYALVEFAQMLLVAYRESDVIGRIGEAEFGVLLTGTALKDSEPPLRRTEELVREYNLRHAEAQQLDVDMAAVAYDPEQHGSVADLIRAGEKRALLIRHGPPEAASIT